MTQAELDVAAESETEEGAAFPDALPPLVAGFRFESMFCSI